MREALVHARQIARERFEMPVECISEDKFEFGEVNLEAVDLPVLQFKRADDGAGIE